MSTSATSSTTRFLESHGAEFLSSYGLPAHFGDPNAELEAFSSSVAMLDRSSSTCIRHIGAGALDLLHRLSTNDLLSMQPGESRTTLLTSERGRIIDALDVVLEASDRLLLLSDSLNPLAALDWIDRFTIIEDAEAADASQDLARIALIGPRSEELGELLADGFDSTLVSKSWGESHRLDIVMPRHRFEDAWDTLASAGACPSGELAFEAARVDRGIPAPGYELTDATNPLEAGLKDLVSFTKGCYIGQEVVARLDTYDKLQRRLVRLTCDSPLERGSELTANSKRAGVVTSVSEIAGSDAHAGLGFVRRDYWEDGTVIDSPEGSVTVHALPVFA